MKFRYLALAAVICLFSSVSRADSIDQFVLIGPSNGIVYTWTWTTLASPAASDPNWLEHNPPGVFGWYGISVLTEGPPGFGVGVATSHDLFFETADSFQLGCNCCCGQGIGPIFTSDLYSGTFANPTFLLGNYVSLDGRTTLTITSVPEAPELAMMGVVAFGILGALKKRF